MIAKHGAELDKHAETAIQKAKRSVPAGRCVATPRKANDWGRTYRGWDHINCTHPTPPPAGYHHCQGDPGCTILIRHGRYCFLHGDLSYDLSPADRARPVSHSAVRQATGIWRRR